MIRSVLLSALIISVLFFSLSFAGIPPLINYQGMLTTPAGSPVADGQYNLTFKIYGSESGNDSLWWEYHTNVDVTNGLFNIILGSISGLDLPFDSDYWLGIRVGTDPELSPRTRLTSVGYAYRAMVADTALAATPGSGSNWSVSDSVLYTNKHWGIARGAAGNILNGDSTHTHVNLGVACVTGSNLSDAGHQTVSGGFGNTAYYSFTTVGGGQNNTAHHGHATVGGGYDNKANGPWGTVGGGRGNRASYDYFAATVAGGWENTAYKAYATVGGGYKNEAFGYGATVPGGYQDSALGDYSFAAGYRAKALHYGSFVWADSTDADFSSTGANEFAVRASGGMRVIANNISYGGYFDNQTGGGDGFRAYANVSQGTNWGAIFAWNNGTSPAIYAYNAGTGKAGYFDGDVEVTGTINKGALGFKIDHPLDSEYKYLRHSGVESPDMKNVYDGVVVLDGNGEAVVELPDYFEALNGDFRYQLTCIGVFAPVYIAEKINNNRFKIAGGQPGLEISWQVTGIRQDPFAERNRILVEEEKTGAERGKYLHPKAYDLPQTMGINYTEKGKKTD